ncbi:hypothetical protein D3C84_1212730 [compost metagenome]
MHYYQPDLLATQVNTPSGIINIVHDISLGDMLIATMIVLHLGFSIIKWIVDKTWGNR